MIPLRDTVPSLRTPIVNYIVIGLCGLVFLGQLRGERGGEQLSERLGMIPARVWNPDAQLETREVVVVRTVFGRQLAERSRPIRPSWVPPWLTPLTCIFLHGSWMHFIGNMWFLFIFGDNVEDRFGHLGFAAFYLASGLAASVAHLIVESQSGVPTIGASGAIAGVMGAYFFLYPRAQVVTLVPIIVFLQIMVLPAPLFLGIWFAIQFFQGVFTVTGTATSGVAWWAHIGGFVAGGGIAWLLQQLGQLNPAAPTPAGAAGDRGGWSTHRRFPHDGWP